MQDAASRSARTTTAKCDKSTTTSEKTTPKATVHYTTSPPNYHINQPEFRKNQREWLIYIALRCVQHFLEMRNAIMFRQAQNAR